MRQILVAFVLGSLLAGNAQAAKRVIEGAPICVDAAGKTIPCPGAAPVKSAPEPAAAPAAATPRRSSRLPMAIALLTAALIAALVSIKFNLSVASGEFEFEPAPRGPGEVARGFLKTRERPDTVKAVLELYEDEKDVPRRSIAAEAGEPEQVPEGGWRTPIAVTLPADLYPSFKGGWALSVEASVNGRRVLAGDNPNLRP